MIYPSLNITFTAEWFANQVFALDGCFTHDFGPCGGSAVLTNIPAVDVTQPFSCHRPWAPMVVLGLGGRQIEWDIRLYLSYVLLGQAVQLPIQGDGV